MYRIDYIDVWKELDTYEDGCIGGKESGIYPYAYCLESDSVEGLLRMFADHVGASIDDAELDACGETGRVDIPRTETVNGREPTESEYSRWLAGDFDLYYVVYTAYVTESKPVKLSTEE